MAAASITARTPRPADGDATWSSHARRANTPSSALQINGEALRPAIISGGVKASSSVSASARVRPSSPRNSAGVITSASAASAVTTRAAKVVPPSTPKLNDCTHNSSGLAVSVPRYAATIAFTSSRRGATAPRSASSSSAATANSTA
ncbi:MAG: hypothetical protein DWB44_10870 [Chloroflexi bacterium]|nr:hypothetical protein [Chloroflexota bacterium]